MCIWNKVLVGLIGVTAVVLFFMAGRTLKTHQYWRDSAARHERKIDQIQKENRRLVEGTSEQPGIRQVGLKLNKLLVDRRRAWFHCDPRVQVNPNDGTAVINVITDQPDPNGITENMMLYGFEETDVQNKGCYLGEFKVTKVEPKEKLVVLAPTSPLSPREIDRLNNAKRPWTLYEIMPRDNHEIFTSLPDDQKQAMLPEASLPEYMADGKPAAGDAPADRVVDGRYVRPLRDYGVLMLANRVRDILLDDRFKAATGDQELLDDALAQARQQEKAAKQDVALAEEELNKYARERDAVATYRDTLEKALDAVQTASAQLIEKNRAMAGQIAKQQLEAARRIDQRTRAMARSGTGG